MTHLQKTLLEIINDIKQGKVSGEELVLESLKLAKKASKYNPFTTLIKPNNINNTPPFYGIPFVLKDNYSTKNIITTASSKMLNNFTPLFDAAVFKKLKESGATLIGKTTMDELSMGGGGVNACSGIVYNPYDLTLNTPSGGSSAGSAVSVALGIVPFAIGSDTGDSIRKPASHCGLVGLKPTYGRISRYGLFSFATSLDHVGFFTRSVEDSALVLSALEGYDINDSTSSKKETKDYLNDLDLNVKGKKLVVIKEVVNSIKDRDVLDVFENSLNIYKEAGVIVDEASIDLDLIRSIFPIYMILSCSEASSNNANLTAINFGNKKESSNYKKEIIKSRSENLSFDVKKRLLLGEYCLLKENKEDLFIKAQKARYLLVKQINDLLENYDALILPATAGNIPSFTKEPHFLSDEYLIGENHLAIANFAGLPSLTLPMGFKNNFPLGINLTSKAFDEQTLLNLSFYLEGKLPFKNLIAKEALK